MLRSWALLVLGVAGCGRIGFDHAALTSVDASPETDALGGLDAVSGLTPLHQYSLNNTFADDEGGPLLAGSGGTFVAGGYQFGANQGLTGVGIVPQNVYTIDLEFAFADLGGWRKIIDYEGLTLDSGFYTYDGALQYVIVPGSDFLTTIPTFVVNAVTRVTLTRDASNLVVAYITASPVMAARASNAAPPASTPATSFMFTDPTRVAALTGTTVSFFIDDAATGGGEAAAGIVRRIRIYDIALTAAQVAATP